MRHVLDTGGAALVVVCGLLAADAAGSPARAQDAGADAPATVMIGGGAFDINDDEGTAYGHAEYRFGADYRLWRLTPFLGVAASGEGALYGYGGLGYDIRLGRHLAILPSLAAGAYHDGDGKDLGHAVQFRSGVEIAWRFDNAARLGLGLYHISNASLGESNEGTEIATINLAWPF